MDKSLITELKIKAAQRVLFGKLAKEKHIGLFEAIELSSGEFLSKANMQDGKFRVYGGGGSTKSVHDKWNIDFLTIGIGRVGARCGCVFKIFPQSWVTDNAMYVSKIKGNYDLDFLLHYLSYCNFNQYANTAAQPVISQKRISIVQIPHIDIGLQKEFVEILTTIEIGHELTDDEFGICRIMDRIEKNVVILSELTHQQTLLNRLRQSILQEAVQGKLTAQWRQESPNVEPPSELLRRIREEKAASGKKEKPLPPVKAEEMPFELPEGWVWCRLEECSINRDGERKPISQSDRERRAKIYDYYGASGVIDKIDGFTHDGDFLLIGEDGANLVARSTPIAFIAKGKFWVNNHAHVLQFIDESTLKYLEIFFNAIDLKSFITGGFQPKLSQGNLNIIPIALPPLPEQQAIVATVERLLGLVGQLEAESSAQRGLAEGLLQAALREAMSGNGEG